MHNAEREEEMEAVLHAVQRLAERYPGVGEDDIRAMAVEEFGRYDDAHVRDFVPVLVERAVTDRLRAGAASRA